MKKNFTFVKMPESFEDLTYYSVQENLTNFSAIKC